MLAGALILSGCNKAQQVKDESEEFCVNNGWTFEIVTSDTATYGECTLPDGTVCDAWEYVYGNCPSEETPSTYVKTSLTVEDIEHIEEVLPPLSYTYKTINKATEEVVDEWTYTAPDSDENKLIIPEYETMVSREVTSSWIEDEMIYTLVNLTQEDGKVISVLYVNDPETLFTRAISVETDETSTLYSDFLYPYDLTGGATNESYEVDYGTSQIFTQWEFDSAVDTIMNTVNNEWKVKVDMHKLYYAGDEISQSELQNRADYDEILVMYSDFHSPVNPEEAWAFNPDFEYTNYNWILWKKYDWEWTVLDTGY